MMLVPGRFDRLEREANLAYDPHQFVTFPGVEWTQVKTGHYTCIFSGERLDEIHEALRERDLKMRLDSL